MLTNKKVRLIPHWIVEAVQRRQLPLTTVFDLEKLLPIVSANDLIGYCALDDSSFEDYLVGKAPVQKSNSSSELSVCDRVFDGCNNYFTLSSSAGPDAGAAVKEFASKIGSVFSDPSIVQEVKSRLFTEDCKQEQYKKPFIIYDISPEYLGVVIYPGFFVTPAENPLQSELIESILKQLYVYAEYHEVCRTALFRRYLERLASYEVIVND